MRSFRRLFGSNVDGNTLCLPRRLPQRPQLNAAGPRSNRSGKQFRVRFADQVRFQTFYKSSSIVYVFLQSLSFISFNSNNTPICHAANPLCLVIQTSSFNTQQNGPYFLFSPSHQKHLNVNNNEAIK